MQFFARTLLLVALGALTVAFSIHPLVAPIRRDLTSQTFFGALGGMFIIVLLVERVTEIAISIWRQADADSLKEDVESLSKDPARASELLEKSKARALYQARTKSIALLVGFSIAVVVCCAGLGLLDTIIDTARGDRRFLRGVDILLTSGLVAGGSDGFHQFVSALETFFSESKKRMEGGT